MKNATTEKSTMKKATKGLVAGALGIGLLTGGATFATWSDQATIEGAEITAGNLDINTGENGPTWQDISKGADSATPIDPATFRMVPGDKLQMTDQVEIVLDGDNLAAKLGVTSAYFGELANDVKASFTVKHDGVPYGPVNIPIDETLTLPPTDTAGYSGDFTIEVYLELPSTIKDRVGAGESLTLGETVFTLTQTR